MRAERRVEGMQERPLSDPGSIEARPSSSGRGYGAERCSRIREARVRNLRAREIPNHRPARHLKLRRAELRRESAEYQEPPTEVRVKHSGRARGVSKIYGQAIRSYLMV